MTTESGPQPTSDGLDQLTRRSVVQGVVQGVGVLAGATVLAATTAPPAFASGTAASIARGAPGAPAGITDAPEPPSADAVTPGLTYITYTELSFAPAPSLAASVAFTLTGVYVPNSSTPFSTPVDLPAGSTIKEVTLAGRNSYGVGQLLTLQRQALASTSASNIHTTTLVTGDDSLRTATGTLAHVVDADYGYYLRALTRGDASQTLHGARIGYVPPTPPGTFHALPVPVRIYDSRPGTLPAGGLKTKFADKEERVLDATLGTGVPFGASSVLVNLAATNTNPGGYFSLFKNGVPWPSTSTLNWGVANTTVSSLAATQVAAFGNFKARCEGAGGADLIVDVVGWFS